MSLWFRGTTGTILCSRVLQLLQYSFSRSKQLSCGMNPLGQNNYCIIFLNGLDSCYWRSYRVPVHCYNCFHNRSQSRDNLIHQNRKLLESFQNLQFPRARSVTPKHCYILMENSNRNSTSTSSREEALRRMTKLVSSFMARADCAPFREPVDWRGLELWDYPKIIKKMMDLGTIKRKLDSHKYATAFECAEDVRLVWSNCKTYNADGSDFFLIAESLSKRFEDRYRKIKAECTYRRNILYQGPIAVFYLPLLDYFLY